MILLISVSTLTSVFILTVHAFYVCLNPSDVFGFTMCAGFFLLFF